jgi:hypothetical protein
MKTIVAVIALALVVAMPLGALAAPSGCCVCDDGTCTNDVRGMKLCSEQCAKQNHGKGVAFNARGSCSTTCSKATATARNRGAK